MLTNRSINTLGLALAVCIASACAEGSKANETTPDAGTDGSRTDSEDVATDDATDRDTNEQSSAAPRPNDAASTDPENPTEPAPRPRPDDSSDPDSSGPDSSGPDSSGPDSSGPDSSGPDSGEPGAPNPNAPDGSSMGGPAAPDSGNGRPDGSVEVENPLTDPADGPPAGNPEGDCPIPAGAGLEDVSQPDRVIGSGTPQSCTGEAVIEAVARGGVITFDCGPDPVTITLDRPAKVFNDASDVVVIDGGGLVTLSGGGTTRILYMNTCDEAQRFTTPRCDDQDHPRLAVQNITFIDGNSRNEPEDDGGGAIYASGGRFKIINSRFFNNVCTAEGQDLGGGGVRVFQQHQRLPVYVVNSTFGGAEGYGNSGANGGGLSSIDVNWTILNSVFTHNTATGHGANPAQPGTPGGGSGGAIYNDGGTMALSICGTRIEHNESVEFGPAIFFVSNNHDGTLRIADSVIRNNNGNGNWEALPGISMHDDTIQIVEDSILE